MSSLTSNDIVTGEKIQQLCNIYIGTERELSSNPSIRAESSKHVNIHSINGAYDNPKYVFCYPDVFHLFSRKVHYLQNDFILVTHSSDINILPAPFVKHILQCDKLIGWFGQNVCFYHTKLHLLPIGLANIQWPHGNLSFFDTRLDHNVALIPDTTQTSAESGNNLFLSLQDVKKNNVYFNFTISTCPSKRQKCYNDLKDKLAWLEPIDPLKNLERLQSYKFCICPLGNGVDTHRLWECLYVKVVPIVTKCMFTMMLRNYGVPMVMLNDWNELDVNSLQYEFYLEQFRNETLVSILYFDRLKRCILECTRDTVPPVAKIEAEVKASE